MRNGKTVKMPVITALLGVILTSLVFITIIGNILVCLSVVLVRKLRKPQNYLLVSLAVSDLFVSLFVMPFAIVFELNDASWPLSDGVCDLWVSADVLSCTASILNLCAISVDRYQAITRPLEYSGSSSPRRMLGVIGGVWLSAACVSLPPVLLLGNEHENHNCIVSQKFWYQIYATMASFYVPLCVMVVVYAKILRVVADKKKQMTWTNNSRNSSVDRSAVHDMHYLQERADGSVNIPATSPHNHDRQQPSSNNPPWKRGSRGSSATRMNLAHLHQNPVQLRVHHPSQRRQQRYANNPPTDGANGHKHPFPSLQKFRPVRLKDHKASTTLGLVMGAFIICWLPFFVLALIRPFVEEDKIPGWVSSLFLWLGYFNSSLNPVIYATTNRDFRRPFREILCFRCSTLDDLMRREFYDHQYGGDEYCVRNKKKLPGVGSSCVSGGGPLSPTSVSETNILTNNTKINNTNSTSCPSLPPPPPPPPPQLESFPNKQNSVSQTHTPIKLQNQNAISSTTTDQESSGLPQKGSPQWTPSAERNKMNITLETTDPETDVESDGFNCRMVAI
ncbi:5-hydroxytryptamine receptor 1 isoform X1 [Folsomia candida]|uniref:5-hydroxytryptamine receptor 1 isoform X1 n=1 Tax=Folsomia candida TaxID=158441 RepID=UPI001604E7C7|nr:5-hydroxytryptamine receptor 1 isoform X1 [Folsomia candida]XP_035715704.1 5-hydroxytryptamine receptor 1 isoform X1 [Folsomia candida]